MGGVRWMKFIVYFVGNKKKTLENQIEKQGIGFHVMQEEPQRDSIALQEDIESKNG